MFCLVFVANVNVSGGDTLNGFEYVDTLKILKERSWTEKRNNKVVTWGCRASLVGLFLFVSIDV